MNYDARTHNDNKKEPLYNKAINEACKASKEKHTMEPIINEAAFAVLEGIAARKAEARAARDAARTARNADEATRKKILNDAHESHFITDAETDSMPVLTIEERFVAAFEKAIIDAISFVAGTADCQLSTTEIERHSMIISALKNIVERNEENVDVDHI